MMIYFISSVWIGPASIANPTIKTWFVSKNSKDVTLDGML